MAGKIKILLAEDNLQLGFVIKDNLEEAGFDVINCTDGEMAWESYLKKQPDICILDVNLPYRDGFNIAKKIRQKSDLVPILFLTAKSMIDDKLKGFAVGGDDYIVKPFHMKELLSRIQVFLRRNSMLMKDSTDFIRIGQYEFHLRDLKLIHEGRETVLTSKEKDLLEFLCYHPKVVIKREEILLHVWGKNDFFLGRSMDVYMTRLRKFLAADPSIQIETVHGVGFRFVAELEMIKSE